MTRLRLIEWNGEVPVRKQLTGMVYCSWPAVRRRLEAAHARAIAELHMVAMA